MKSILVAAILFSSFASLCLAISLPSFSCAIILCASGTCIETESGPRCIPNQRLAACIPGSCPAGETCEETSEGARCVAAATPTPDPVMPTPSTNCSVLECAPGEVCIDTPGGGGECTPDTGCAAVTCVVGSGCVVTPTGPQCVPIEPTPTPVSPGCACAQVFDPVCCRFSNGEVRTEGNECECTGCGTGVEIVSRGECPPTSCAELDCASNCAVVQGVAQCVSDPIPSCACAAIFDPVCCQTPSGLETKASACLCGCEPSSRVLKKGGCSSTAPPAMPPTPPDGCLCIAVFDPVCCRSPSGAVSQASNSCECECSGGTVVQSGCNIITAA